MDEFKSFWLKEIKDIFKEEFENIQIRGENGKYLFLIGSDLVVDISISSSQIYIAIEDYSEIKKNSLLTKRFSDSKLEQPEIYSVLNNFGSKILKIVIGDDIIAINQKK